MGNFDWTSIVLGAFTLLSSCGWFVSGRKHRQEVKSLKADNRLKDMELARLYVEQFQRDIAEPLRHEVRELRDEVMKLKNAMEGVNDCTYRDGCPVRERMRQQSEDGDV